MPRKSNPAKTALFQQRHFEFLANFINSELLSLEHSLTLNLQRKDYEAVGETAANIRNTIKLAHRLACKLNSDDPNSKFKFELFAAACTRNTPYII